jgi:hypothetical protein
MRKILGEGYIGTIIGIFILSVLSYDNAIKNGGGLFSILIIGLGFTLVVGHIRLINKLHELTGK